MLGLAEYVAASAELTHLGRITDEAIENALPPNVTRTQATAIAKGFLPWYQEQYERLLYESIYDVGQNAVEYYAQAVGPDLSEQELEDLLETQVERTKNDKYYGASLKERLQVNARRLEGNMLRSALVAPEAVAAVFSKVVPFGSQTNIDRRVMLAMHRKLEQDIAESIAELVNAKFLRWRLSGMHSPQGCMCEKYAENVDKEVINYLESHAIDEDPKGLFFRNKVPPPPHPNCQCEIDVVSSKPDLSKRAGVRRSLKKVRNLISRIRKARN